MAKSGLAESELRTVDWRVARRLSRLTNTSSSTFVVIESLLKKVGLIRLNLHDKFSMGAPPSQPLEHEGGLEREVKVGVLEVFNHKIIVGVSLG